MKDQAPISRGERTPRNQSLRKITKNAQPAVAISGLHKFLPYFVLYANLFNHLDLAKTT